MSLNSFCFQRMPRKALIWEALEPLLLFGGSELKRPAQPSDLGHRLQISLERVLSKCHNWAFLSIMGKAVHLSPKGQQYADSFISHGNYLLGCSFSSSKATTEALSFFSFPNKSLFMLSYHLFFLTWIPALFKPCNGRAQQMNCRTLFNLQSYQLYNFSTTFTWL